MYSTEIRLTVVEARTLVTLHKNQQKHQHYQNNSVYAQTFFQKKQLIITSIVKQFFNDKDYL